jgi:hypothetical protein
MANCSHIAAFDSDDELVPEAEFKRIFGVCNFTIFRWRRDDPDFPEPDFVRKARSGKQQLRYYTKRKVATYRARKFEAVAA